MPIPISDIQNAESGSSVRGKLNDVLDYINAQPLKIWRGLVSQIGASAPTAKVLVNTLGGTITWARAGVANYTGTLAGAFTVDKTFILVGTSLSAGTNSICYGRWVDVNGILLVTQTDGTDVDGLLSDTPIEIAIYP